MKHPLLRLALVLHLIGLSCGRTLAQTTISTPTTLNQSASLGDTVITSAGNPVPGSLGLAFETFQAGQVTTAPLASDIDCNLIVSGSASLTCTGMQLGTAGSGGLAIYTGGNVTTGEIHLGSGGGKSNVSMDGGLLTFRKLASHSLLSSFTSNGGVFKPVADEPDWITGFSSGRFTVSSGGWGVNTNGFNVGVKGRVEGSFPLYKSGAGTVTFGTTPALGLNGGLAGFTGNLFISQGKLVAEVQPIVSSGYSVESVDGSTTELVIAGGTGTPAFCQVGHLPGSKGVLRITGGELSMLGAIQIGSSGDGTVIVEGGSLKPSAINLSSAGGGTAKLVLKGGTLATDSIDLGSQTSSLTFDGGTLQVTDPNRPSMYNFAQNSVTVAAGGARLDTNGNAFELNLPLSGPGGLTKLGTGELAINGTALTYAGDTVVEKGAFAVGSTGTITSPAAALRVGSIHSPVAKFFGAATFSEVNVGESAGTGGLLLMLAQTADITCDTLSIGSAGIGVVSMDLGTIRAGLVKLGESDGSASVTMGPTTTLAAGNIQGIGLTSNITSNGGTLRALGDGGAFISGFALGGLVINPQGLTIDSNGFSILVQAGFSGTGPLTKKGEGEVGLYAPGSWTGVTFVKEGTLAIGTNVNTSEITVERTTAGVATLRTTAGSAVNVSGLHVAYNAGTVGRFMAEGGSLTAAAIDIGASGTGILDMEGGQVITNGITIGHDGGTGTINLNVGVLEAGTIERWSLTSSIVCQGGTLRAHTNGSNLLAGFTLGSAILKDDGLVVDTNGYNVSIAAELSGSGLFTKIGAGTLSLTSTIGHSGRTLVSEGTLNIASARLAANSNVTIEAGAVLNLAFTGTNTVSSLTLAGVTHTSGIWGAVGSGATHETPLITGTGRLLIIDEVTAWLTSNGLATSTATSDDDHDGIPNLLEYFSGTNPNQSNEPTASVTKTSTSLFFTFNRRKGLDIVSYVLEWSDDLAIWQTSGLSSPVVIADLGNAERMQSSMPLGRFRTKVFVRVRVLMP